MPTEPKNKWRSPIRKRKSVRYDPCRRCGGIFGSTDLEIDPSDTMSARKWVCHSCANWIRRFHNKPEWDYELNCWTTTKHRKQTDPDQMLIDEIFDW